MVNVVKESKSLKEYLAFKPVKGQLYRIVSRKRSVGVYIDKPALLDLGKYEWFVPDKQAMDPICLCLDEMAMAAAVRDLAAARIAASVGATGTPTMPIAGSTTTDKEWKLWWKSYYKVLHQEKICLVHVSWLEKV